MGECGVYVSFYLLLNWMSDVVKESVFFFVDVVMMIMLVIYSL